MGCLLEESDKERLRKDYIAVVGDNMLKLLAARFGAELQMPNYFELMYPEIKIKDERTAEQIKQDLLKRLGE